MMGYDLTNSAAAAGNRSFPPFLQLSEKIGQFRNGSFLPFFRAIRRAPFFAAAALTLTACGANDIHPTTPGEHVIFKDRLVEVQRPCPVKKPVRPAPLARPLPADPGALVSLLTSKLLEWAGPGGYGESAESKLDNCIKPAPG